MVPEYFKRMAGRSKRVRDCFRFCRGAAMLESLFAMFVIFLVLFGLLQLFYFAAGQFFTDYAALRGIRSYIVGFSDYLVAREVRVNAIGASGQLVTPSIDNQSYAGFQTEKAYINTYLNGWRWMEYEHWFGGSGQTIGGFKGSGGHSTHLTHTVSSSNDLASIVVKFTDYALLLLSSRSAAGKSVLRTKYVRESDNYSTEATSNVFFGDIDLTGKAAMYDHAPSFLQLGSSEADSGSSGSSGGDVSQ